MDALRIDTVIDGRRVTMRVAGELDAASAPELAEAIRAVCGEGATTVVLDLAELEFVDSAGLSVLVASHKRLASSDVGFAIEGAIPRVRRVFEIAGLDRVLTINE